MVGCDVCLGLRPSSSSSLPSMTFPHTQVIRLIPLMLSTMPS